MAFPSIAVLLLLSFVRSEFVWLVQEEVPYNLSLSVPVEYQGFALKNTYEQTQSFALSLNAKFGRLSQKDFETVRNKYSSWWDLLGLIVWHPQHEYHLIDFLPPQMQATNGYRFRAQTRNFSLPSFITGHEERLKTQETMLVVNCWGMAFSVLYAIKSGDYKLLNQMVLSAGDEEVAYQFFTSFKYSLMIQDTRSFPMAFDDASLRNRRLLPGDVLLVYHKTDEIYLDHVAIMIDQDLYFEKAGTGDQVPFRLNDWKGITSSWIPRVFEFQWRRFNREHLPSASQVFGLQNPITSQRLPLLKTIRPQVSDSMTLSISINRETHELEEETYVWIKNIKLAQEDGSGRFVLPQEFLNRDSLEVILPADPYLNKRQR
jgi:hypothetical protein